MYKFPFIVGLVKFMNQLDQLCANIFQLDCLSFIQIQLNFFDPQSSSTASLISCSDSRCKLGLTSEDSVCSQNNQCGYTFQYGDGSGTSGYYVADLLHLGTIVQGSLMTNSSSQVVFG